MMGVSGLLLCFGGFVAPSLFTTEVEASQAAQLHGDSAVTWLVLYSKLRNFLRLPEYVCQFEIDLLVCLGKSYLPAVLDDAGALP